MSLLTEQLSSAAQNQLATQISVFQAWSQTAFGGLEKLIALNFNTAKQSLENANSVTRELFAVKQAQELLDVSRAQGQPQLEKLLSYGRELVSISRDTRAELWHIVSTPGLSATTATTPTVTAKTIAPEVPAPSAPVSKPATKKPASAKPIAATKQLTLLAEPEAKPVKTVSKPKPAAKLADKAPVKTATQPAAKAQVAKQVEVKPAPAKSANQKIQSSSNIAADEVKPVSPIATANVAAVTTPASTVIATEKNPEKKTVSTKKTAAKTVSKASPASSEPSATEEKKSAVKFPFPAVSSLKKAPAFPANGGKPAYKAKSSAATGAKKPVRQ
ncbi:TIGR01841 family phasin [Undibacterium sp. Di27W]|uniref:phasin family protein n=1 Tax=Undibacterium sp. Di27W TaxID=3413036 RepID=UPI003BEFACAD